MFGIILFATFAVALEWWQPDPTLAAENTIPLDGWTPKPTAFFDLAKRQQIPASEALCGYIDGDPAGALICTAICGFNTVYSWFGCCASASFAGTDFVPLGCPVVTECVPYSLLGECGDSCASNTLVRKCTDLASPYCGTAEFAELTGLRDFGCAPTPFSVQVDLTTTGFGSAAVTSINAIPSSTRPAVLSLVVSTTAVPAYECSEPTYEYSEHRDFIPCSGPGWGGVKK